MLDDAGGVACHGDWRSLDASPGAHPAAPADNRMHHARIVLNLCILQHDRVLDTSSSADDNTGTNGDVGAQLGGRVNGCGGVDVDGGHDRGGGRGEFFGLRLEGLL